MLDLVVSPVDRKPGDVLVICTHIDGGDLGEAREVPSNREGVERAGPLERNVVGKSLDGWQCSARGGGG